MREFGQQALQPVDCLDSGPGQFLPAVHEHPQRLEFDVGQQFHVNAGGLTTNFQLSGSSTDLCAAVACETDTAVVGF